mgnify:CR=1 FL=1|jgi:hypothetical protein
MTIRINVGLLLLPLALLGCQGPGTAEATDVERGLDADDFVLGTREDSGRDKTGKMIAVGELPESHQSVLEAWKVGGFVWEVKRSEALADRELAAFLVDNLLMLLIDEYRAIKSGVHDQGGAANLGQGASFERTRAELILCGAPAAEALAETLAIANEAFAALSKEILMELGRDAAMPVAALLDRDKAAVRLRAAIALGRLPSAGADEGEVIAKMQATAMGDGSDIVRVRATSSLGERGLWAQVGLPSGSVEMEPYRSALEECLKNSSEEVRRTAASGLSTLGDQRGIPALIEAAAAAGKADRMVELRSHVSALRSLSRKNFGLDMVAWRTWWRESK